jgi:ATP synthase protein I
MSDKLASKGRKAAYRLVAFQATLVLVVSLFCWVMWEAKTGLSALVGGSIYVVPNLIFSYLAFAFSGARQAKNVVMAFYLGEVVKLVLTIVLFTIAFLTFDANFASLFVSFALVMFSQLSAPLFFNKNNGMKNGC